MMIVSMMRIVHKQYQTPSIMRTFRKYLLNVDSNGTRAESNGCIIKYADVQPLHHEITRFDPFIGFVYLETKPITFIKITSALHVAFFFLRI